MSLTPNLNFLLPNVKNYAWGKKGKESFVYHLWSQNLKSLNVENEINKKFNGEQLENVSFAELWFGTHPTEDNTVVTNNGKGSHIPLRDFLINQIKKTLDGDQNIFGGFTFIMKILSIEKPLSLQCHPDNHNATYLHQKYPFLYPDANHKPEMGIVVSDKAQILCGFRPYEEFLTILNNITPLKLFYDIAGNRNLETSHLLCSVQCSGNTNLYQSVLIKTLYATSTEINILFNEIEEFKTTLKGNAELPFVVRSSLKLFDILKSEFVHDNACLCCFFLNHFHLQSGEAIYIPVNVLHTYLSGDILECMAVSDNVIRCGLSSKPKDLCTLLKLVDYTIQRSFLCVPKDYGQGYIAEDDTKSCHLYIYQTPVSDFQVLLGVLSASCFIKKPLDDLICYPCILLILYGTLMVTTTPTSNMHLQNHGKMLTQGQSILLHPTESYYYHNPQHRNSFSYNKPIQFLGVSKLFVSQLFEGDTLFVMSSSRK